MIKRDIVSKTEKGSVKQKKAEKDADELRKIVSLSYNAFAAFLNACEKTRITPKIARKGIKKLPAHLDRAIINAESYSERDLLYRRLASHCYKTSQWFQKNSDYKQALKWMNLALRFLRLSMDPKKQAMDEKFEAELADLERKIEEMKKGEATQ